MADSSVGEAGMARTAEEKTAERKSSRRGWIMVAVDLQPPRTIRIRMLDDG